MSDVLSQSQIDMLLNSMREGSSEPAKQEKKEKEYKKYDFYSPKKFTRERLKILKTIHDNYCRIIVSHLNGILRMNCEIEVISVEEQRYNEFSNALTESDVVALAKIDQEKLQEETPILVHMDTGGALTIIDRMIGGDGELEPDLPSDYKLTDLELNMYEDIISQLIGIMGGNWENYMPLEFSYVRTEVNPTMVQLIGFDETVVIVSISIRFSNCQGTMSLCLPGVMLANIFSEISKNTTRRTTGEDKSDEIFGSLRESDMEIIAELARPRVLLSDIYHLNVGDVLDIKRPKDAPVYLNIGGRRWFDGRLGVHNKQMAVKIGETYIKA